MKLTYLKAATAALILSMSSVANAGLIFSFEEVGGNVTMTSSGSIDTSGLVVGNVSFWGGTGIEENGNYDILGGTSFGAINASFGFNAGTDFSQWASASGPWTSSSFNFSPVSGSKSFATFIWDNGLKPGLGIRSADLNGSIWSTDQNWIANGYTLASLGMNIGSYTVTDAVSGEFITIQVGDINQASVPEPSTLIIFALGILGLASRKFNKQ